MGVNIFLRGEKVLVDTLGKDFSSLALNSGRDGIKEIRSSGKGVNGENTDKQGVAVQGMHVGVWSWLIGPEGKHAGRDEGNCGGATET